MAAAGSRARLSRRKTGIDAALRWQGIAPVDALTKVLLGVADRAVGWCYWVVASFLDNGRGVACC